MDNILDLIEQRKIKRAFRARDKFSYPGVCCHITQRAPGREKLFLEEADFLLMLYLLKQKSQKFDFEVYSFCLMSNHIHLQIKLEKPNLSESMKSLFGDYAQSFNKKYERKGHVFCGAYRQAVCLDDNYALAVSIYIHLNPVRAGIVSDPRDYRWSSCNLYTDDVERESFINEKFILEFLNKDISQAREIYQKLLLEAVDISTDETWEKSNALDLFKFKFFQKISGFSEIKWNNSKEIQALEEQVLNQKIENLNKKKRLRTPQEKLARKYLIEQLVARGFTIVQIAEKFQVSRQSIHNILNLTN